MGQSFRDFTKLALCGRAMSPTFLNLPILTDSRTALIAVFTCSSGGKVNFQFDCLSESLIHCSSGLFPFSFAVALNSLRGYSTSGVWSSSNQVCGVMKLKIDLGTGAAVPTTCNPCSISTYQALWDLPYPLREDKTHETNPKSSLS